MAGDSRRRRPLAAAVLVTTVASLASCSILTSFDGYVGPGDASSPVDSAPDSADGSPASDTGSTGMDSTAVSDSTVASDSSAATDSTAASDADAQSSDGAIADASDAGIVSPDVAAVDTGSSNDGAVDGSILDAGIDSPTPATIAFVQAASSSPLGSAASVDATFAQAQNAGDLIVVAVGWTGATSVGVTSVRDSSGNGYAPALAATHISAGIGQALYYSRGIMAAPAGGNTVTIGFSAAAGSPQLVVAEYAGLDTVAPLDTSAGFGGRSTTATSGGDAATTAAPELIVGAGSTQGSFTGAGALFTLRNLSGTGTQILEDRIVTSAGVYTADAPLASSAYYIMQMAAFR
jgi:hypothetical protein